jgi:arsenite oxidase small subunit
MDRRGFNSLCTGLIAGAAAMHTRADVLTTPYPESKLIHSDGQPISLHSLPVGEAFVFSYPFVTTPCFLVRLSSSSPAKGAWPGGLDHDQSVVAFSAICSHKMSHPAKPISHISYRSSPVTFYDTSGARQTREGVISCCSERSVYDPAKAAVVLSGPAPAPLAAITLQADSDGRISAVGSVGPDQYERFLNKFGFRLAMEYGVTDVRARSGNQVTAILASKFSKQQVLC